MEFKPKGLTAMKSAWLDFAGDLVEPVALLAAGATKVEAAWAGVRGMFLTRVLGPLGMVAGAATGLLLTTRKLVGEWAQLGVRGAATLERMTIQFRPLLGSMSQARQRVRDLFEFAAKTPFQLGETAEANRALEKLTKGALSTKDGMMLVGDAAAVSGAGFANTALWVGRLYDNLQAGRPIGEAAMRLQEMSLISGETRNAIESMQAANVAGNEIWKMVERELARNKGAMDDLSRSMEGLESTHADVKQQMESGFGKGFMEGEKAAIKASSDAMERFTPVAEYFGEVFGMISNAVQKGKARIVDMATSFPGFVEGAKAAGMVLLVVTSAIVAASGALLGRLVVGILSATAANAQLVKTSGSVAAAETIETAVSVRLSQAKVQLAAAKAAVARGSTMEAVGSARAAAAHTVAAVRTNALSASQMILRGVLTATGTALRFVVAQLRAMVVAIATNPWMLLATAVLAVAAVLVNLALSAKKAREELENYERVTRATVANLEAQRRAVQTITDLRKLEGDVVRQLARAYRELEDAAMKGDSRKIAAARDRVTALEKEKAAARQVDPSMLRRGQGEVELEDMLRERERDARWSREDFEARGVDEAKALTRQRYEEQSQRQRSATDAMNAELATRLQQESARRAAEDLEPRRQQLMQEIAAKEASVAQGRRQADYFRSQQGVQDFAAESKIREEEAAVVGLRRELEALLNLGRSSEAEIGLASESELTRLKTAARLYDELRAAHAGLASAAAAAADADEESRAAKEEALSAARQELAIAEKLADLGGIPGSERERQDMGRLIERIESRRSEDLDPEKLEQARQAMKEADYGAAQAKIDAEAQVAAIRLRGIEAERAALSFEERKLALAKERGMIGEREARQAGELLDARRAALEREAGERRGFLQVAFEESRLKRLEEDARRNGDRDRADTLRAAADAQADRRRRAELILDARDLTSDRDAQARFADSRLAEEQAARRGERDRDARERALDREGSRADATSAAAELNARVLQLRGQSANARRMREDAARLQDEVRREEGRRQLLGQGFSADEADRLANASVKTGQANRLLEELTGRRSTVVADSLAAVGGGGNSYGSDPEARLLERMLRVMEQVRDNTREDIDRTW